MQEQSATQGVIDTDKMMYDAYHCNLSTLAQIANTLFHRQQIAKKYMEVAGYTQENREHMKAMVSAHNRLIIEHLGLITIP